MNITDFKEKIGVVREKCKFLGGSYENTHSRKTKNGWKYVFFNVKLKSIEGLISLLKEMFEMEKDVVISKVTKMERHTCVERTSINIEWIE